MGLRFRMKIDRVVQSCKIVDDTKYNTRISKQDYTAIPEENGTVTLRSNPGKTIAKGLNVGVEVKDFKLYNRSLMEGLGLDLIRNNVLEFMEDIETDFKMIDCKNIVVSFHNALTEFGCKRITNTFKGEKGVKRDRQSLIGIKGYKNNNYQIKLYSKNEERMIPTYDKDLIRIEIILDKRAIDTLKVQKDIDDIKVIEFLKMFLEVWKRVVGRANQHNKPTLNLIKMIENKITK